jgi:hypothetical protein
MFMKNICTDDDRSVVVAGVIFTSLKELARGAACTFESCDLGLLMAQLRVVALVP